MDEKELKTSPKQRFFIILIAVLMVGSIAASYIAIVISGSQGSSTNNTSEVDEAKIAEYTEAYEQALADYSEAAAGDFAEFVTYKSEVKGYNETSANENGVQARDLKAGTGAEVGKDNYLAYYIGWCADESVFDSSFDDVNNPTKLKSFIDMANTSLIEGWYTGMEGTKIGGVREITIPGELAYGSTREICGGYNKPLKFLVMTVAREGERAKLADAVTEAMNKLQYAYYGVDYDSIKANGE